MLLYTDKDCNTVEQEALPLNEFQNFIDGFEMEVYRPPILREDVKVAAKVKLILQVNAKHLTLSVLTRSAYRLCTTNQ